MRPRRLTSLLIAAALTAALLATPSFTSTSIADTSNDRVPNSYLVSLRPGVSAKRFAASMSKQYGGRAAYTYDGIGSFNFAGSDANAKRLAADPRVEEVEADRVAHLADAIPPGINHLSRDMVYEAHDNGYVGTGVRIAVIDTGVDANHEVFQAHNNIDKADGHACVSGGTDDNNGHGTATASNAVGQIGVAHEGVVIPVRVFPGSGENTTWSKVICGINWVADHAAGLNIQIVSMSIAGSGVKALAKAIKRLVTHNLVIVAAAGNNGGATQQPASYPGVIAATALGAGNKMASFSASGGDMTAPGVSIRSADNGGPNAYSNRSGTSRSAPQVAGAAAILLGEDGALSPDQVLDDLKASGTCPNGNVNGSPSNCGGKWKHDDKHAEPLINAYCAGVIANAVDTDIANCGF